MSARFDSLVPNRTYNAGIYVRLSREDSHNAKKKGKVNTLAGNSGSIENQRDILRSYVKLRGWHEAAVYTDDGYGGGNFDRPGFRQMMEDAKAGLIDLILCKDLSRLGRDYIEVGRLTGEVFPTMRIRFIALMDNLDSDGETDLLPFRSLLNDYHLKDLSRKIKSVLTAKAKAGEYVGAFAPYGYLKDPARHGRLIVDPTASETVKRIFSLRRGGMAYARIAGGLNKDGIPAPRAYHFQREGKPNPYKVIPQWREATVKAILKNEVYLGHSVKFKQKNMSYKSKRQSKRPEQEWIRAENTHEGIISQETWDAVQMINQSRKTAASPRTPSKSLFSGLLRCADCGGVLACNTQKRTGGDGREIRYQFYYCAYHTQTGRLLCSWHRISELALLKIIREDVQRHIVRAADEDKLIASLQGQISEQSLAGIKKELDQIDGRLRALDTRDAKLYEDRLTGAISLETFKALSSKAQVERAALDTERGRLAEKLEAAERRTADADRWLEAMREFLALENIDHDSLQALIKKIVVGEKHGECRKRQDVRIYYRFVGCAD